MRRGDYDWITSISSSSEVYDGTTTYSLDTECNGPCGTALGATAANGCKSCAASFCTEIKTNPTVVAPGRCRVIRPLIIPPRSRNTHANPVPKALPMNAALSAGSTLTFSPHTLGSRVHIAPTKLMAGTIQRRLARLRRRQSRECATATTRDRSRRLNNLPHPELVDWARGVETSSEGLL